MPAIATTNTGVFLPEETARFEGNVAAIKGSDELKIGRATANPLVPDIDMLVAQLEGRGVPQERQIEKSRVPETVEIKNEKDAVKFLERVAGSKDEIVLRVSFPEKVKKEDFDAELKGLFVSPGSYTELVNRVYAYVKTHSNEADLLNTLHDLQDDRFERTAATALNTECGDIDKQPTRGSKFVNNLKAALSHIKEKVADDGKVIVTASIVTLPASANNQELEDCVISHVRECLSTAIRHSSSGDREKIDRNFEFRLFVEDDKARVYRLHDLIAGISTDYSRGCYNRLSEAFETLQEQVRQQNIELSQGVRELSVRFREAEAKLQQLALPERPTKLEELITMDSTERERLLKKREEYLASARNFSFFGEWVDKSTHLDLTFGKIL